MKKTVLTAALLAASSIAALAQDSGAQANNPLAKSTALNFQNQYIGKLTGSEDDANTFYLRYAKPFEAFGGEWIARLTVPMNTFPEVGGGDQSGLGDINLFAAYLFDMSDPAVSFGIGPQITVPSASNSGLGSEKWSLGFANVLFNASNPKFQWGYLLTWQASVAGSEDATDVNMAALQPFAFYQLGTGWYLRSSAVSTYDFETGNYTLPLGLGIGKVIKMKRSVANAFFEPQYTIAHEGDGQSEWGIFAGLNFQY